MEGKVSWALTFPLCACVCVSTSFQIRVPNRDHDDEGERYESREYQAERILSNVRIKSEQHQAAASNYTGTRIFVSF